MNRVISWMVDIATVIASCTAVYVAVSAKRAASRKEKREQSLAFWALAMRERRRNR